MGRRVCLVVLCGLPGSGKTTLARHLHQVLPGLVPAARCLHVCYDDLLPPHLEQKLILDTTGDTSKWKMYRKNIVQSVDEIIHDYLMKEETVSGNLVAHSGGGDKEKVLENILRQKYRESMLVMGSNLCQGECCTMVIVIDDNMYYSSMRYEYYQLARKYTIGYLTVYVHSSVTEAVNRNSHRAGQVMETVIHKMSEKMEIPNPSENMWESGCIQVSNCDKFNVDTLVKHINSALDNPVQPLEVPDESLKEESQVICSKNTLHQVDQILRQLVRDHMLEAKLSGMDKSSLAVKSRVTNHAKTTVFTQLKNGFLKVASSCENVCDASKDKSCELYVYVTKHFTDQINSEQF